MFGRWAGRASERNSCSVKVSGFTTWMVIMLLLVAWLPTLEIWGCGGTGEGFLDPLGLFQFRCCGWWWLMIRQIYCFFFCLCIQEKTLIQCPGRNSWDGTHTSMTYFALLRKIKHARVKFRPCRRGSNWLHAVWCGSPRPRKAPNECHYLTIQQYLHSSPFQEPICRLLWMTASRVQ